MGYYAEDLSGRKKQPELWYEDFRLQNATFWQLGVVLP